MRFIAELSNENILMAALANQANTTAAEPA